MDMFCLFVVDNEYGDGLVLLWWVLDDSWNVLVINSEKSEVGDESVVNGCF